MSLEQKISELTAVMSALLAQLQAQPNALGQQAAAPVHPAMNATPMGMVQAPVTQQAAAPVQQFAAPPVQQQAPTAMPGAPFGAPGAAPFGAPPVQQAAAPTAPFSDSNGLIKYATDAYMALGEAKGPALQNIITSLGHANINDVRPDQYGAFYALVEQLKVS